MNAGTILLVEDNASDEALTLRSLRKGGIVNEVMVAHDGAEALDFLLCAGAHANRDPLDTPVLVLLDINLPKLGGLQVLKRLRQEERMKTLPVVVLTSSDEEKDVIESYRLGANSYVRKPVEFSAFTQAVQQLGCYWLLLNKTVRPGHVSPALP